MKKLDVKLKNHSYPIFYKSTLLKDNFIIDYCKNLSKSIVIITHNNLKSFYAKPLFEKLKKVCSKVKLLSFENGESNKSRKTKEALEDEIFQDNFTKDSLIISLGGGVVSDISGFIASTYMRGIPYIIIPTTLLAMVDASIGGKTAINTPLGKNLIGTFFHPSAVFMDFDTLKSLDGEEMKNGMVEMLKHALIKSKQTFYDLLESEKLTYEQIINSLKIKLSIIQEDENENSLRKILNFGHTISHAIEAALNYKISHGKALSFGILIESYLSYMMDYLSMEEFEKIFQFLKIKKLLDTFPKLSEESILKFLKRDKKNIFGKTQFTLLKKIGQSINNVEIIENHIVKSMDIVFGGIKC